MLKNYSSFQQLRIPVKICVGLGFVFILSKTHAQIGSQGLESLLPRHVIERMASGDAILLVLDAGQSKKKLIQCMRPRTLDFPLEWMEEFAREAQVEFLRAAGDGLYVPELFMRTPCEDAGVQEFLDKLDISTFAQPLASQNQR